MLIPQGAIYAMRMLDRMDYAEWRDAEALSDGVYSPTYARKALQELARHGIIEGTRGRVGGYRRIKRKVTLGELCECFTALTASDRVICGAILKRDISRIRVKAS